MLSVRQSVVIRQLPNLDFITDESHGRRINTQAPDLGFGDVLMGKIEVKLPGGGFPGTGEQ